MKNKQIEVSLIFGILGFLAPYIFPILESLPSSFDEITLYLTYPILGVPFILGGYAYHKQWTMIPLLFLAGGFLQTILLGSSDWFLLSIATFVFLMIFQYPLVLIGIGIRKRKEESISIGMKK